MVDKGLGELESLTPGETLLVLRRRMQFNQHEAAAAFGVSHARYSLWERDLAEPTARLDFDLLMPHERCMLYRRRAGYTQARVAQELGRCRWWVNQMEQGYVPCDELIDYWEN